jgi:5'-nucleotidase
MLNLPADLCDARILIANDDSIHADGIRVLEEIALSITPNVWVVAPETQMSAAGHSLTIHMPLRIKKYDDRHYSVTGTPTDAVLVGVQQVMKDFRPHLVLTGINHGQNTADDVTYSGTIAAAIEATLMNIPAIACSQDYDEHGGGSPDWAIARVFLPRILRAFAGKGWPEYTLMSVNFPRRIDGVEPKIRPVMQGHYTMAEQEMVNLIDPRGRPYLWIGPPPPRDEKDQTKDVGVLKSGQVTVTPLSLNMTDHATLKTLGEIFR